MGIILSISLMSLFVVQMCSAEIVEIPKPTSAQLAWQEAEIGALVCYELHTFGKGRYNQGKARVSKQKDVNQFNPKNLDTDQWIKSLKDAEQKLSARVNSARNKALQDFALSDLVSTNYARQQKMFRLFESRMKEMNSKAPDQLVPLFREWIELLFKYEELQKLEKLQRGVKR